MPPADAALALVHQGWEHLKLQRPLAAWASWQQALRLRPDDPAATQALEHLAGSPVLPSAAKTVYRFRPPEGADRRARWDAAFQSADMADLSVAVEVFGDLAGSDPDDPAARYNHALCLAWLGRNAEAIEVLDQFVRLSATADFEAAVGAWTLAEVLRQGAGAEHLADDLRVSATIAWPDQDADPTALDQPGRIAPHPIPVDPATGVPADPEVAAYEWLDRTMPASSTLQRADDLPVVLATIVRRAGTLEISTPDPLNIPEIEIRLESVPNVPSSLEWSHTPLPLGFLDAALWTFRLPPGLDEGERSRLTRESIERYYEELWVHLSRVGLGPLPGTERHWPAILDARLNHQGTPPPALYPLKAGQLAAGGDAMAGARLEGIIRLREQLAARAPMAALASGYPFDRLRRRVGLRPRDPSVIDPQDYSCASIAELEQLDPAALETSALAEAYRSAQALGLDELASRLAMVLVERDPSALGRDDPPGLLVHTAGAAWLRGEVEEARAWLERAERAGRDPAELTAERELFERTLTDAQFARSRYEESLGWLPDAARRYARAALAHRRAGRIELADRLDELAHRADRTEDPT